MFINLLATGFCQLSWLKVWNTNSEPIISKPHLIHSPCSVLFRSHSFSCGIEPDLSEARFFPTSKSLCIKWSEHNLEFLIDLKNCLRPVAAIHTALSTGFWGNRWNDLPLFLDLLVQPRTSHSLPILFTYATLETMWFCYFDSTNLSADNLNKRMLNCWSTELIPEYIQRLDDQLPVFGKKYSWKTYFRRSNYTNTEVS